MRWSILTISLMTGCSQDPTPADTLSAQQVPSLTVSGPERATWSATGAADMTGQVEHISTVVVNGESHAVSGDAFSVPVSLGTGINYFETEGIPTDGGASLFDRRSVLAGTFAPAEGSIPGAVAVRVNQGGLDDAADIVSGMVDAQEINSGISEMNPIVDLEYALGTSIAVNLQSIYFGEPMVDLIASGGALGVEVILPELLIDTGADISVLWIEGTQDLQMEASYAVIRADLALSLSNGVIGASLENTTVSLEGFSYDISLLPGEFIEDNLFDDTIREAIEDTLVEEMETMLPAAVTSLQDDLDLSYEADLLGIMVGMSAEFSDIGVDSDGVWIGMDVAIDTPATDLTGNGYLFGDTATPEPDRASDMALMLADDALNRAMYELWLGGLLSQTLSTEDGSLDPESLSSFGITDCTITTDAALPPVIVEQQGALQLQLGEITADLRTPGFALGEFLTIRVAGAVNLDLVFDNGSIAPALTDLSLHFDILDTDWEQDEEAIVNLLNTFITPEQLLGALDGLSLELPAIDGVSIDNATIDRVETGVHSDLQIAISAN